MTARIPREFIQQLLERLDIVDLIDGRVPLKKKSSNNYFACCPFHNEKSASFSVSQNKQFYYCFGCGAHGNAIDFLIQYDRLEFPEAVELLAKQLGLEIPRESLPTVKNKTEQHSLYEVLADVAKHYQSELKTNPQAIQYLKNRGLTGEIAKTFGLGFAKESWDALQKKFKNKQALLDTGMLIKKEDGTFYDRFRSRIMFPIHDRRGRIIGFGGRILDKGEPKYLNSPETVIFQKGRELYGLYHALKQNRQVKRILIVEGYMDVIALFQHGINYAVATLGTATTATHLERLFRYTPEIIFCFDGDNAGRTAAERALSVLLPVMKDGCQIRFMFLPQGEDPDSMVRKEGKAAFEKRMLTALSLSDFFFQHLVSQTDMRTTDGRARFTKMAVDYLKEIPEGIFQQMMYEELAKKARTSVDQFKPTVKKSEKPAILSKAKPPSSLRRAIMLLLQQPMLAQSIEGPLPELTLPGFELLLKLVNFIKQQPGATTGMILENWRGTAEETLLARLAQKESMLADARLKSEFLGAIKGLKKIANEQTIERLLAEAAQGDLTPEQKEELRILIHTKNVSEKS